MRSRFRLEVVASETHLSKVTRRHFLPPVSSEPVMDVMITNRPVFTIIALGGLLSGMMFVGVVSVQNLPSPTIASTVQAGGFTGR